MQLGNLESAQHYLRIVGTIHKSHLQLTSSTEGHPEAHSGITNQLVSASVGFSRIPENLWVIGLVGGGSSTLIGC